MNRTTTNIITHSELIKWKKTNSLHSNSIRSEPASRCFILEAAKIILCTNAFQLCVIFKCVHDAFSLNSVGALYVVVIREKELLRPVKLPPASHRFFRPIIPTHPHFGVVFSIGFDFLYLSNVGRFLRILLTHQDGISHCIKQDFTALPSVETTIVKKLFT